MKKLITGRERFVQIASSFFGMGYAPFMPGTIGSLAGLGLAWFLNAHLVAWTLALSLLGFWICRPARDFYHAEDPSVFVLDEVCGMMLCLIGLPRTPVIFLAAFILFRILDTLKPWPIRLIQENKHASSILWDDLAAALFVNAAFQIFIRIF